MLLYRQGGRVVSDVWTGSAGGHFEDFELNYFFAMLKDEVSDDLVSNEGELKWFPLNKLNELEMPYTARYVMDHYCSVGQYSDKIYTGVANENEVIFLELPEF